MKQRTQPDDGDLLPVIKEIVDKRPTYGYPRVTALLNRQRFEEGLSPVNHKKVYRIDLAGQNWSRSCVILWAIGGLNGAKKIFPGRYYSDLKNL